MRRGGAARAAILGVALLLYGAMATVAVVGFLAVVGSFLAWESGLPEARSLESITFTQESIIYARDGKKELARFSQGERRETATYDQLPPFLIDATTAIEDKTFWTNTGFDALGILSAGLDSLRGDARGASTITQQLVRQRLLPADLVQDPGRRVERKLKEIIQSIRVTEAFPGDEGKRRIITAYLNQNFYGNNSYGVKTAARGYWRKDLDDLSLAQLAILAALPQSPSSYDLMRNAIETEEGDRRCPRETYPDGVCLVVPEEAPIVQRRDYILGLMASDPSRLRLTGNTISRQDLLDAQQEPVVLDDRGLPNWSAPHFVWYVREQLTMALCGEEDTCPQLEQGGLRVITTLDWRMQRIAERWVQAAALLPHRSNPAAEAEKLGVPYTSWMASLRGKNLWNAALSALDYQTGEILAYVGSADYYETRKVNRKLQPQFDVLRLGWRQPGSAFKPITYATGVDTRSLTASTMLMDVTTDFGNGYTPTDYDGYERGPLRLRLALQQSLNIPAVKALELTGEQTVFDRAEEMGLDFLRNRPAGPAMALGTMEVHPLDLAVAYATLANRGRYLGDTSILSVKDTAGNDVLPPYSVPEGREVLSSQASYVVTDILAGNTDPNVNPIWGDMQVLQGSVRRPATLKTGTNNDAKDLSAYGYIAPPTKEGRDAGEHALVIGVWAGNSDNTPVSTAAAPVFSLDVAAPIWQAVMREITRGWAVNDFRRPNGLQTASVDAFTGFAPSVWSKRQVSEIFLEGTVPGEDPYIRGVDVVKGPDGRDYRWKGVCGGQPVTKGYLVLANAEEEHESWLSANRNWIARARRGIGVAGGADRSRPTRTMYFLSPSYQPYGSTWGAPFAPVSTCDEAPSPSPSPSLLPSLSPSPFASGEATAEPTPVASEPPTPEPTPGPTRRPPRTPRPTPAPTEAPTPPPASPAPTEPPMPSVKPAP